MIDSVAPSVDAPPVRRKAGSRPDFSYAEAAAALEKNAGQTLKAHGGRPQGEAIARNAAPRAARDSAEPAPATAEQASKEPARTSPDAPAQPSVAPVQSAAQPNATAPPAPPQQISAGGASPQPAPTPQIAAAAAAPKPAAAASAGATDTARAPSAAKLAAPTATTPVRSPEEFAELIARRLDDGATEFDLRLDPPELGRIEARLTVGDDGSAELRIKFDNQAAYDLFARDEAALRLAFADAGYSFGDGAFAFVLDERPGVEPRPSASPESVRPYAAQVAARALDIRV